MGGDARERRIGRDIPGKEGRKLWCWMKGREGQNAASSAGPGAAGKEYSLHVKLYSLQILRRVLSHQLHIHQAAARLSRRLLIAAVQVR